MVRFNKYFFFVFELGIEYSFWIAATKFSNGGKFYWMGHDVPISYTNWGPSQPSDTEGSENCVELRKDIGFKWNDIDCQHNRYFVCEEQTLQSKILITRFQ